MKAILIILIIFHCNLVVAQQVADTTGNEEVIFVNPETYPEYPGGSKALHEYLEKETQRVQKHGEFSGTVYIRFTVKKDGSLTAIEVLKGVEDFCKDCNEEALRLVRNMPNWKPGKFYDKPVETRMVIPVKFCDKE